MKSKTISGNPFYKQKVLISLFLFIILMQGCKTGWNIEGVPFSQSYNKCNEQVDFGDLTTLGDPGNKFMITLPYGWDIREVYSDTVYGVFATNAYITGNNPDSLMSVSVTGYKTDDSLTAYFRKEVRSMKKGGTFKPVRYGKITINGQNGYWLEFGLVQDGKDIYSNVVYLKRPGANEIFLLQSVVFKTGDYGKRICAIKNLVETFTFETFKER